MAAALCATPCSVHLVADIELHVVERLWLEPRGRAAAAAAAACNEMPEQLHQKLNPHCCCCCDASALLLLLREA
jgi:hypothetical protein